MNVKTAWFAAAALAAASLSTPVALQAQGGQKPEQVVNATAVKGRGTASTPDENIKTMRGANVPGAKVPAPAAKGGAATRGGVCAVHFDNRTSLYIDMYLDGNYRGTLSPWGDSYPLVGCGETRLYAKANFTDGSSLSWGPVTADLNGVYTWRLNP